MRLPSGYNLNNLEFIPCPDQLMGKLGWRDGLLVMLHNDTPRRETEPREELLECAGQLSRQSEAIGDDISFVEQISLVIRRGFRAHLGGN